MFRRDLRRGKSRKGPRVAEGSPAGRSGRDRRDSGTDQGTFVLYVEGPRDREILGHWAKRLDPALARCVEDTAVILGGKQPARAISDFRKRGAKASGVTGLILLDRDDQDGVDHEELRATASEAGLEVFVWGQRHIESYLLVPDVIRRVLSLDSEDRRVEALIEAHDVIDPALRAGKKSLHAKKMLGVGGALSEGLGVETRAGEIARAMRREDLHEDVHALFERVKELSGLSQRRVPEVEVIVRGAPPVARD